jgi:anti-sigma regulatory factor (Ser/Thr protein kinase)
MDDREVAVGRPGTRQFTGQFVHAAVLCSGTADYLTAVGDFADAAAQARAPLHVAVPHDRLSLVQEALRFRSARPARAVIADMSELGRNPARLIPAARSMAADHPDEHLYCLWEPAWPRRSAAELREIARHEALCNLAFEGQPITVTCLYDATVLDDEAIGYAVHAHPVIAADGRAHPNPGYLGAGRFPPGADDPLPSPEQTAEVIEISDRLDAVRSFAARHAYAAGLSATRATDLLLAVSELAANAYRYAGGSGVLRAWCTGDELVCQLEDTGYITDPLAATWTQPIDATRGYGLWLVNKVCDLVERRTGPAGTTTRLHMRRHLKLNPGSRAAVISGSGSLSPLHHWPCIMSG